MKESHSKIENNIEDFEPLSQEEVDLLDDGAKYEYYKNLENWGTKRGEKIMKQMEDAAEEEARDLKEEAFKKSNEDLYKRDPDEPYWQR